MAASQNIPLKYPNMPHRLFRFLLKCIDYQKLLRSNETVAHEWLGQMALASVIGHYVTEPGQVDRVPATAADWKICVERAREQLDIFCEWARKKKAAEESGSLLKDCYPEEISEPRVFPYIFLMPLALSLPLSDIRDMLLTCCEPALVECYITELGRTMPDNLLRLDEQSAELCAQIVAKHPSCPGAAGKAETSPLPPGITSDAIVALVRAMPAEGEGEKMVAAIKHAAQVAALGDVEIPPEAVAQLVGAFGALWELHYEAARQTSRGRFHCGLTAEIVEVFLSKMEAILSPDIYTEILNKWSVSLGVEKLLSGLHTEPDILAAIYVRVCGAKTLLQNDKTCYWLDGKEYLKLIRKGRVRHKVLEALRAHIWCTLNETLKSRLTVVSPHTKTWQNIDDALTLLHRASCRVLVCENCIRRATKIVGKPVEGPPRRFPGVSKETERVLLEICDEFDGKHVEFSSDLFDAYIRGCGVLHIHPKFSSSRTLLKDVYKCDKFQSAKAKTGARYVVGIRIKERYCGRPQGSH